MFILLFPSSLRQFLQRNNANRKVLQPQHAAQLATESSALAAKLVAILVSRCRE